MSEHEHEHEFKARTHSYLFAADNLLSRNLVRMCACGASEGRLIQVPTPFGEAEIAAGRWTIQ